ncbi:SLOG cluster 4 domain-containing protein [Arthrobacter humicola]
MPRAKRIIAIFGGSREADILDLAERLGNAVGAKNEIALTGGDSPKNPDTYVKYRALRGAFNANALSLWIGVTRTKQLPAKSSPQDRGLLVASTLDHQRNYVEASMCDAAICLKGDKGTISEMTCALALKRPVALVGDHWKDIFNLKGDPTKWMDFAVETTMGLFDAAEGPERIPKKLVSEPLLRARLKDPGKYEYFRSTASAEAVIDWVQLALPMDKGFPGRFPVVPGHVQAKKAYEQWIKLHAN